jgi:4-amino-4-deoxy-L-arabinose transferase-like glycosyltransferase
MYKNNKDIFPDGKEEALKIVSIKERITVSVFLLYFAVKAFYFAFSIGENIFPDEVSWFGITEVFSRSLLPPPDSPETYQFCLASRVPILAFYLMSKILLLNILPVSNLVFLRAFNVIISIVTIWFAWKLIRLLVSETVVRLLFIVMITNTLMFTFISGAVSHDNLTNLFAILSLYNLILFFKFRRSSNFLLFILFISMGMLTKISFLPYPFILLAVLLFHERKKLRLLPSVVVSLLQPFRWKHFLLLFLCLFFLATNINLYIGNLVKYGQFYPDMDKVVGFENAMQNRLFGRDHILRLFREGKISYSEAQKMAVTHIKHIGDRYSTLGYLESTARTWNMPRMDPLRYGFVWSNVMFERSFGILAHRSMVKTGIDLLPYLLFLLIGGFLLVRRIKTSDLQGTSIYLLFITGVYTLVLMFYVNYKLYLHYGSLAFDIQGRYIFLVLVPIYILVAYYLVGFGSKWWKWGIFLIVTVIFVYGEFPWFLQKVTQDWFLK